MSYNKIIAIPLGEPELKGRSGEKMVKEREELNARKFSTVFFLLTSIEKIFLLKNRKKLKIWMVAMFTCISTLVVLLGSCAVCCRLKKGTKQGKFIYLSK